VHIPTGNTLQVWVQNQGGGVPHRQGEAVSVHFPADALRVLVDTTSMEQIHAMEGDPDAG
jgi:hypothetical protein